MNSNNVNNEINELELYTSEELIQELIKRSTFSGIIIKHDPKEFKMYCRNFSPEGVASILISLGSKFAKEIEERDEQNIENYLDVDFEEDE